VEIEILAKEAPQVDPEANDVVMPEVDLGLSPAGDSALTDHSSTERADDPASSASIAGSQMAVDDGVRSQPDPNSDQKPESPRTPDPDSEAQPSHSAAGNGDGSLHSDASATSVAAEETTRREVVDESHAMRVDAKGGIEISDQERDAELLNTDDNTQSLFGKIWVGLLSLIRGGDRGRH